MILHLWLYDRFQCLRWHSGRQPGAFKRVMTYSYLTTVPLLVIFSVAIVTLKYKEGFVVTPRRHIIMPRPLEYWDPGNKRWVLPLYFVLSSAWSLEMVTHLEELTFWLFLLHQGPKQRDWFSSYEFKIWYLGSMVALLGMPLTAVVTRRDLEMCEAWIFLVGSSASTLTNIFFLHVLLRFPGFIRHVKTEGALPDVVVRLTTFYQLNVVRVVFRFLFTIPLFVLAVDGVQGSHAIVLNPFWSDILLMAGGIGCFVSSAITLMIFFPRSITQEAGYRARDPSPASANKPPTQLPSSPLPNYYHRQRPEPTSPKSPVSHMYGSPPQTPPDDIQLASFRYHARRGVRQPLDHRQSMSAEADDEDTAPEYETDADSIVSDQAVTPMASPVSNALSEDTMWERHEQNRPHEYEPQKTYHLQHRQSQLPPPVSMPQTSIAAVMDHSASQPSPASLHPYVMTFTSPIDLLDETDDGYPRAV
ncbi:hypothetical protein HGRIS_001851 [Hohenbuehelia grisea]|uniref:Uncharacterized protein n=1 Tax=Hohenbuehelia grisea TaxID=104357 RepID=A0ABR3JIU8_9AGAR